MFGRNNERDPDLTFYTVYDSKSKTYIEPFPARNNEVVLRDFLNAFKHPDAPTKNNYFRNAEDFAIFKCGSFDLRSGKLEGQALEHVANLHDIRSMVPIEARKVSPSHAVEGSPTLIGLPPQ